MSVNLHLNNHQTLAVDNAVDIVLGTLSLWQILGLGVLVLAILYWSKRWCKTHKIREPFYWLLVLAQLSTITLSTGMITTVFFPDSYWSKDFFWGLSFFFLFVGVLIVCWMAAKILSQLIRNHLKLNPNVYLLLCWYLWLLILLLGLWALGFTDGLWAWLMHWTFTITNTQFHVGRMLQSLFATLFVYLATYLLAQMTRTMLAHNHALDSTAKRLYSRLISALLYGLGGIVIIGVTGIDASTLSVFAAAMGVAISFGLKPIAENFISGFCLLAERSLHIGDLLQIEQERGVVKDIRTRYLLLRSSHGIETLIPNAVVLQTEVQNLSLDSSILRLNSIINVSYQHSPQTVLPLLVQAALKSRFVLTEPSPEALLVEYADSGIKYKLTYWIADVEAGRSIAISDVNVAIWRIFALNQIDLAVPQRVWHFATQNSDKETIRV